jgi:histidyl-tRNA synthetase
VAVLHGPVCRSFNVRYPCRSAIVTCERPVPASGEDAKRIESATQPLVHRVRSKAAPSALANHKRAALRARAPPSNPNPPFQTPETIPAQPGAYILVIEIAAPLTIAFGGREGTLDAGRYLYCGSAKGPGGLRARIARHVRRGKAIRWHVDHLTERGIVLGAWVFPGGEECALAARLAHLPAPIPGFGSSDCRRCASHLFAWPGDLPLSLPRRPRERT